MSTKRIARGAAWTIGSSILSRALGLIGTLILIRFVAPVDYGEVSAAWMVVLTINQFTTLGVGIYVIATRGVTREEVFHATVIHCSLGLIALVTLLAIGKPLSPLFSTPHMYRYVPGLALSAFVDRLTFMPERMVIRRLSFHILGLYRSAGELIYTLVSVAAAALGWGAMAIVIGNLARSLIRGAIFVRIVPLEEWLHPTPLRGQVLRKIANYGVTILIGGFASFAARRWDNLLVARFFGPAVMGNYNLAYNLADIPAVHIGEQISDVMEASFTHMNVEERKRTMLRSLGVIGLITFPIAAGLGVLGPTIAAALLNSKWAAVGPMLLILSLLSLARPIYGVISSLLLVETGPRRTTMIDWLTLGLLIACLCSFGRISPLWACGAVGATYVARTIIGFLVARATLGIGLMMFLTRLAPPLLACLFMVAAILTCKGVLPRLGVHSILLGLISEIAVGAVTFLCAARLVAARALADVWALVRNRSGR